VGGDVPHRLELYRSCRMSVWIEGSGLWRSPSVIYVGHGFFFFLGAIAMWFASGIILGYMYHAVVYGHGLRPLSPSLSKTKIKARELYSCCVCLLVCSRLCLQNVLFFC